MSLSALVTLCILVSDLSTLVQADSFARRVVDERYESLAYQPYDALVRGPSSYDLSKLGHRHLANKKKKMSRTVGDAKHDDRIARNQVKNPRAAAKQLDKRGNLARRAAASPVPCTTPAASYAQCGGIGYSGPTCCAVGWTCNYASAWYSQCIPAATDCTNAFGTQCGGIGWTGATCCPTGSTCVAQNAYYSACQVGTTSTTTTQAQPTTTTSTSKTSTTTSKTSTSTTASSPTTSKSASTTTSSAPTPTATCTGAIAGAWQQCGGSGFTGLACCVAGYTCVVQDQWYAQCKPAATTSSTVQTTTSRTSTTTSSAATSTATCSAGGGGSDGCAPYTVGRTGVTLPSGQKYQAGGHVNYQAIPCSQYVAGQSYRKPGANWTPMGFGTNFDPNNGQPGGAYIGKSFYDWGLASSYFGSSGFCVTWVQISNYNQHYGEGGQVPICSATCPK